MEPIAIIGIGCRFPGAKDPLAFWELLRNGVDAITDIPTNRWDLSELYDPDPEIIGKMNSRCGGFLQQVDHFDPHFFGISPREAMSMDPQQRLLLEVAWEALEDAGQVREQLLGTRTGVFVGISSANDYSLIQGEDYSSRPNSYDLTGNALSIAAGRLSYLFNFRGPSMAVDTACSSSLVAVHLACQSLWNKESTLALAGGVNIIVSPTGNIGLTKLKALSPDGRCKTFDAQANGYVRSEGSGFVVLKPLSQALADNDQIYALIRGSAINHDGRSKGLTVPFGPAQEALIRQALDNAGVAPDQISYVELHGTGTPLGDPIEAIALGTVLATDRLPGNYCAVGSVKSNIGHLEAASGIAGLIKVALSLKHQQIPQNLHFHQPNPYIPFDTLPIRVQQSLTPWPQGSNPAFAGISSFGFSGTNAHVVLEQPPQSSLLRDDLLSQAGGEKQGYSQSADISQQQQTYLLPLSAHSLEAAKSLVQTYHNFLETQEPNTVSLQNICYTASVRRTHHEHRLAFLADSPAELQERLQDFLQGKLEAHQSSGRKHRHRRPKLVFVFSGQGPQWWAMGRELLEQEPVFRATIEECDALIKLHTNWSLLAELTADVTQSRLQETEIAQPAIFALQVALARLWRAWGIEPKAVVGHSLGEVAAAHIAGVLSLADAVQLICDRGRLMQQATGNGKMAAVELSAAETEQWLRGYEGRLAIAAINSPTSTVVSGEPAAIESFLELLQREQPTVFCKLLPVNYAFHSPQMLPFAEKLVETLNQLQPQAAKIPIFSTVTGQSRNGADFDAAYWGRNLQQPVRFAPAIEELVNAGQTIFLEISPHPVLSGYISQCLSHLGQQGTVLSSLRRGQPERATLLSSLGNFYNLGFTIDWKQLYPSKCKVVSLPSYPWQRDRYWFERKPQTKLTNSKTNLHPLLGQKVRSAIKETLFESELSINLQPFLVGHQVYGIVVLPGAAYLEIALAAAKVAFGSGSSLQQVLIQEPLIIPADASRVVQLILTPEGVGQASFQILSQADDVSSWIQHATGKIQAGQTSGEIVSLKDFQARFQEELSAKTYYQNLRNRGLEYGESFQGIEQLWRRDGEALGRIRLPLGLVSEAAAYELHPVLVDSGFQLLFATLADVAEGDTYLPVGLDNLRVYRRPESQLWIHGQIRPQDSSNQETRIGDLRLFDDAGQVIAEIEGLHVKRAKREVLLQFAQKNLNNWLYEVEWQPRGRQSNLTESAPNHPGSWLLFADQEGTAAALAAVLESQGETCIMVFPGERYELSKAGHYTINPACADDFQQLFGEISQTYKAPLRRVVHLWGLDTPSLEEITADSLKIAQTLGCQSVLHLVQGLTQVEKSASPRLWLVTQNTQPVESSATPLAVAQSTLWGLGRAIALEHPEIWGGMVDLAAGISGDEAATLFTEISQPDREDHLAFRNGQRYVARLVQSSSKSAAPLSLHNDGTYLITGGLGGLGLKLAEWMVEQGARHLVLVGRSDATDATRKAVNQLEHSGAKVLVAKGDVSQHRDVSNILGKISESMPPLRGIIHAAGVLDDGMLRQQDWKRFTKVMAPKIQGAWNLHVLTQNLPLDFFVMFSSVASLLGSPGQGNYAAANAFLDALAHYRYAQGLPGLAINWSTWAEVGMAANLGSQEQQRLVAMGMDTIAPQQGLQVLGQLLQQSSAQVGVVPVEWSQFMQQFSADTVPALLTELGSQPKAEPPSVQQLEFVQRLEKVSVRDRQEMLLAHVQDQVAKVLGRGSSHSLEPHQGFFDIGMDSLTSVELQKRLQTSLGRSLSSTLIFDYPTLDTLAKYLANEMFSVEQSTELPTAIENNHHQQIITSAELKQLSEEDAEELLLRELESIKY
ncbi:type I polyketide synthase [Nostoc sphaeroides CHAB 2801]|uniref:type I polyketide synthase n=1 Tax=Nostoc sphaeroides TaxID=446679 RepID=UPI001E44CF65|nr:type I polyketide synthase [Nostoc sphaeroides]MCC5632195.1 type I polyketide synthase [Nostoc sphaeroides CHAB 2801]